MTNRSPRVIYSVRYDRREKCWRIFVGPKKSTYESTHKADAISDARRWARARAGVDRTVTQMRVFNRDGTISFEATYPRSSDPTRTPS